MKKNNGSAIVVRENRPDFQKEKLKPGVGEYMLVKEHKPKFGYILIKFQMDKGEENSIYRLEKRGEGWKILQLEYEFHPTAKLHECGIEDSIQSNEIELRLNRILKKIEKVIKIMKKLRGS